MMIHLQMVSLHASLEPSWLKLESELLWLLCNGFPKLQDLKKFVKVSSVVSDIMAKMKCRVLEGLCQDSDLIASFLLMDGLCHFKSQI